MEEKWLEEVLSASRRARLAAEARQLSASSSVRGGSASNGSKPAGGGASGRGAGGRGNVITASGLLNNSSSTPSTHIGSGVSLSASVSSSTMNTSSSTPLPTSVRNASPEMRVAIRRHQNKEVRIEIHCHINTRETDLIIECSS